MKKYREKHINELSKKELEKLAGQGQLIDVRTEEEYELAHIKGATLHPVDKIESFNKDKNKTYYIHCKSGNRSAKASEYLAKQGYDVVNLDGGYKAYEEKNVSDDTQEENTNVEIKAERKQFNYSGLQCPGPIVNISKEVKNIGVGDQIEVTVTDPGFFSDIKSWVKQTGHTLVKLDESNNGINAIIQKEKPKDLQVNHTAKGTTIVLFSGELDKAVAAMIIANGARAAGRDVTIFFTFWGLNALKKEQTVSVKKKGIAKMFDWMLPKTPLRMPLSKMNMFGLGNIMMRYVMKKKNVDSLPSLINQAIEQDIKLIACTMSMDVMGIQKEELRDEVEYGGVGTYIGDTENANHNLFI
ncbi:persulfide response sulfurtransferase CstA [Staphylococcus aureus]|uniref:persulfide response sulfurtransferase CstA n=1 Tax=Staphylococcaceae TaxID=90964 RepID=UPI0008780DA9|nr:MULTISPECIES: persulfide response sulfurtransferase CstA [Staphylococcaceae]MDF0179808.1 persulfide response sulfurtransferase CstA [Staphylococcus pseudintermedius]MBG9204504.1 persulfide response sulfurtransferase CstA [Mammaliicoccus sciuri]MDF0273883.1 persulfide response sulfurtransferase CstA [Staphylococcus pseudintermedius]MDF0279664.1 persulfide response sulfurtransferase CstA [Staphylococcus pseudintermedius]MDF0281948.1 persulfide response sulfurtransferase CstA [Staphylococcus p